MKRTQTVFGATAIREGSQMEVLTQLSWNVDYMAVLSWNPRWELLLPRSGSLPGDITKSTDWSMMEKDGSIKGHVLALSGATLQVGHTSSASLESTMALWLFFFFFLQMYFSSTFLSVPTSFSPSQWTNFWSTNLKPEFVLQGIQPVVADSRAYVRKGYFRAGSPTIWLAVS